MKVSLSALLAAVLASAVGCSSATAPPASAPAPPPKPAPTPAAATAEQQTNDRVETLLGLKPPVAQVAEMGDEEEGPTTVVDPQTGRKLMRVPKSKVYYVKNGLLYNAIVNLPGAPYVREDEKAYYIETGPDKPVAPSPGATDFSSRVLRSLIFATTVPSDPRSSRTVRVAPSSRARLNCLSPLAGVSE